MSKPHALTVEAALEREGTNLEELMEIEVLDLGNAATPTVCSEGCTAEADGTCQHGYPSVLRAAGLI